ncbi:MAG: hypothetical protein NTX66_00930 [Candidatus Falkowbacteria bacterium]|nr:hypothetical protein [Candidatus Falkowbacteria bacterium]
MTEKINNDDLIYAYYKTREVVIDISGKEVPPDDATDFVVRITNVGEQSDAGHQALFSELEFDSSAARTKAYERLKNSNPHGPLIPA